MIYEPDIQTESRIESESEEVKNELRSAIKDVPLETEDLVPPCEDNIQIKKENEELSDCEFISIKTEEVWFDDGCDNVDNSSDNDKITEVPSSRDSPVCKKLKRKCCRKKVATSWSDERVLKLIHEVESRRCLWDVGCAEYKLRMNTAWQEVANAIPVSFNDCIEKWHNLRTTFNMHLEELKKKNPGQGTDEATTITWKYFMPMMFLKSNKLRQCTQSTSSIQSESVTTDESNFTDLGFSDELCSPAPSLREQRRKRKSNTPTSLPSTSRRYNNDLQSMHSKQSQSKDLSTAFAEYIAAELRSLTQEQAAYVRAKLRRAFNDIMDEVSLMVPQPH